MNRPLSDAEKAQIDQWFAYLQSGLCPHCKAKVVSQRQVGRCVYAEPCGHRLYQGKVGAFRVREGQP